MPSAHTDQKALFLAAIEIESDPERQRFLDDACGDNRALKADIQSMLDAHAHPATFLAEMDELPRTTVEPAATKSDAQIGPYKIREKLAEGGMGIVYVAEQSRPVRRKVALKVIKPGTATQDVVARFEAERQALAMMDHPNIARVIDGGAVESGQPYFVMELVQGLPLNKYCDTHELDTEERLELFVKVCRAVQHAHQKGIIHRDLKPSNVLVARVDDEAVPKVIDFGIAKAVNHKLSEHTVYTQFSQLIGTPLYMSPEQTELGVIDIDTRSDVYSLGALLYELLTGCPPFNPDTLNAAGFDEMRRIIREQEPPRPSAMVSTLKAAAVSTVAQRRQRDPRKLSESLAGELDWIVMKALEKDRNRRYESASALAADIERFLWDQPVLACPPSPLYLLRKFAARHQGLVAAIALASVFILITAGLLWKERQRTLAALNESNANFQNASRQQEIAEANLRSAVDAVDQMLTRIGNDRLSDVPQMEQASVELLEDATKFYTALLERDPKNNLIRFRLADAQLCLASRLTWRKGTQARALSRAAIDTLTELVSEFPDQGRYQLSLSQAFYFLADNEWASFEKSTRAYKQGIAVANSLLANHPEDQDYRRQLAACTASLARRLVQEGQVLEAEAMLCQMFERFGEPVSTGASIQLANIQVRLGKFTDADVVFDEAIRRIREETVQGQPAGERQRRLAVALRFHGDLLTMLQRYDEAERRLNESLSLWTMLAKTYPTRWDHSDGRRDACRSLMNLLVASGQVETKRDALNRLLGNVRAETAGDFEVRASLYESIGELEQSLADLTRAIEIDPVYYKTFRARGIAYLKLARYDEALNDFTHVLETQPDSLYDVKMRAYCNFQLSRYAEALSDCEKAMELNLEDASILLSTVDMRKLLECKDEHFRIGLRDLAECILINHDENIHARVASSCIYAAVGDVTSAQTLLPKSDETISLPDAMALNDVAWCLAMRPDKGDAASTSFAVKAALCASGCNPSPETWNTLGVVQYRAGAYGDSVESLDKCIESSEVNFAYSGFVLAMAKWQLGSRDDALDLYERSVAWMNEHAAENQELKQFKAEAMRLLGIAE